MGRSTTSCLKIITCGRDSAETDDLQVPESKGSTDKRGWSFRKRSARHRILSNTVTSETPSSANKESPEFANLNFQPTDASPAPEKTPVIQCTDEKPQLSTKVESETPETIVVAKDESEVGVHLEESDVIAIQAAVRGFLARRELLKLKNVVKMQAAVRGHLVRQHAVGALRCVQAIVKMQALVRARRARLLIEGKDAKAISGTPEKEKSVTKPTVTYISIEKLLNNSFARQLMQSTPKTRPIHIKCDSTRQNSGWNWLERWMSVSSAEPTPKPEMTTDEAEGLRDENLASPTENRVLTEDSHESADSVPKEIVLPSENEDNLITYEADNFKFQARRPTASSVADDSERPLPENSSTSDVKETTEDMNSHPNQTMQSEVYSHTVPDSLPQKSEIESEQPDQPKRSMKRLASEELETEGKKFVYGSRKGSNPSFIAAQTKFEELSSTANSNVSSSSFDQVGVESNMEAVSSGVDGGTRTKELKVAENQAPHNSKLQFGGSECGTELSVTSTLDSPDRSEVEAARNGHEDEILEQEICNPTITKDEDVEAKELPGDPVSNLPDSVPDLPEAPGDVKGESMNSIVSADGQQGELKPDLSASDIQRELDSETGGPASMSSPQASPRSHVTVPESQGTPSSQLSVKSKKNRTDKSGSGHKRKSLSAGKRSPSNPNHDSGARNSVEQLPKDQKNGKRRNSFGATRPENSNQEPRDSSSSGSIPHFMQATESARAKLNANNSPRSSPDVMDRDFVKKRHSLPGANGRHGSPRIQRSLSQAQQGAKGSGGQPVHEKKWLR